MSRKLFALIFAVVIYLGGNAQDDNNSVIPPSPQTAEFEKYINYNVSIYNGVPDISIPLYTIHLKGLDVPISLSYHASGIKYHQANGDVGVGWTLNPGYRVSRTIYGQPDDWYDMPDNLLSMVVSLPAGYDQDTLLAKLLDPALGPEFPHPAYYQDHLDGEYDLFSYLLPTENGTFVIRNRTTKTVQSIEQSNVKIYYNKGNSSYISGLSGFLNFDITDDEGNKYLFGERTAADENIFESVPDNAALNTAWALTDIITSKGDQLKFKYSVFNPGGYHSEYRTETVTDMNCVYAEEILSPYEPGEPTFDHNYQSFVVNEISNSRQKITFERSYNFLTNIKIYNSDNSLIRTITFFSSDNALGTHRMLDSIQIKDRNLNAVQTYKFVYQSKDFTGTLGPDQWGYYNDALTKSDLHTEFQNIQLTNRAGGVARPSDYFSGFADRKRTYTTSPPDYFSLTSITYPTGGTTTYEYESNLYKDYNNRYIHGGGQRIKTITSNDGISNTLVRSYVYGDDGAGIAKILIDESYFADEYARVQPLSNGSLLYYAYRKINFSNVMKGDVGASDATASIVNYPKVTELINFGAGGKKIYYYNIGNEYEIGYLNHTNDFGACQLHFQYFGIPIIQGYRYWDKPLQREIDYYTADNQLIKKDSFTYVTSTNIYPLTGIKAGLFATAEGYNSVNNPYIYSPIGAFIRYTPYTITYGRNMLINKKEIMFQGEQSIVQNTDYQYNNTFQLSKITTFGSDGRKHHVFNNYPNDYVSGSGFVDSMVKRNIVSYPVETVQAVEDINGNLSITSGTIKKFKLSNATLLESILNTENRSEVPQNAFKFSNRSIGVLPIGGTPSIFSADPDYKTKITYDKYDVYNDLVQQTSSAEGPISYLWDYQNSFPICKVLNADSASISYTSFEADGAGNWIIGSLSRDNGTAITGNSSYVLNSDISKTNLSNTSIYIVSYWTRNTSPFSITGTIAGFPVKGKTINGWTFYIHKVTGQSTITVNGSGAIDELRLYPADAQMTTYTYEPLVGMTSQCDAANRITYYEYDGLQRLKYIRDQDGNILKSYEYQYQAATTCGSNCSILQMTTLAGTNTLGYPVGVFNVNGKLLGNATNQSQYLNLWNADTANTNRGTLAAGGDPLHFQFTLIPGKTIPTITGCRYFQMDIAWNNINSIRSCNGAYIDFGDGTGMHLAAHVTDSLAVLAPNTTQTQAAHPEWNGYTWYYIHTYPDNSLKTLTFYHNDQSEISGLDNNGYPASSLPHLRNLRGNLPQYTDNLGGSCYQDSSMSTVAGITNWNTIHTIKSWGHGSGDIGMTPALHMGYAQDFMAGNKDLEAIGLAYPTFIGCFDSTFRISRLKSDWNTYFTHLKSIYISDAHWNREDLSGLKELNAIYIIAGREKYSNDPTNNPQVPIPDTVIDNIFIQVAAGAGQTVTNGYMNLYSGGPNRTAASDAAVATLLSKGWILYLNGVQLH